jgi:hypothetical protein
MNRNQTAMYLFNKIESAKVPLAIFVINGAVKATKVNTNLFAEAFIKMSDKLMGVYNSDVELKWLEDDLKYMGMI